jgi:SAM-dependent methyltransferase
MPESSGTELSGLPLQQLENLKECRTRTPSSTHRRTLGGMVSLTKRVFARVFRPFIRDALETQARFNDQVYSSFLILEARERAANERIAKFQGEVHELLRSNIHSHADLGDQLRLLRERFLRARVPVENSSATAFAGDNGEAPSMPPEIYRLFHLEASTFETSKKIYQGYMPYFQSCRNVVDLGCGGGPFLDALREAGIQGYGVDLNEHLLQECRARDLTAVLGDAIDHLESLKPGEVDGIFAGHLVEHLEVPALLALISLAHSRLAEGGVFLFESPNTENLLVLSTAYFRDLTHQLPRHPETYRLLVQAAGFKDIQRLSSHSPDESFKFLAIPPAAAIPEDVRSAINANVDKLNQFFYSDLNFAILGRKRTEN